jgi:hypothetical protein
MLDPFTSPKPINPEHGNFSIDLVGILVASLVMIPYAFYQIRNMVPHPVKSKLTLMDYYIIMTMLIYLVIGTYQQYFWTKTNRLRPETVIPSTGLDTMVQGLFGINDSWTYIYNFIYYFVFGFIIISIKDYKHFAQLFLGAVALMTGLSFIWYIFPNKVESRMKPTNYFLKKTQAIDDNNNNACPSAHVVFAMYAFYLLRNVIGVLPAVTIPILISLSCLTTTQHVSTDIILGILYSIGFYNLILHKINPSVFS